MDMNKLAKAITLKEGKKISLSIAQVKEVLRCLRDEVQENPMETLDCLIEYFHKEPKAKRPKSK